MKEVYLVLLSILLIIWWIGVWGCIETMIYMHTKNNPMHAFCVYFAMASFVLTLFIISPTSVRKVLEI